MATTMKFNYLYRDAGNYKKWGEVNFANSEKMTVKEASARLPKAFDSGSLFIASQIDIPEVFLFPEWDLSLDDHCFHEFFSVELSDESPSDKRGRSIKTFIEEVESESNRGWLAFDPFDRTQKLEL